LSFGRSWASRRPPTHQPEHIALALGRSYPAEGVSELVSAYLTGLRRGRRRRRGVNIGGAEVEVFSVFAGAGIGQRLHPGPGPFRQTQRFQIFCE